MGRGMRDCKSRLLSMTALSRVDLAMQGIGECPAFSGRGVVVRGGRMVDAWVCIRMLRHLGCGLPVELWFRKPERLKESEKWLPVLQGQNVRVRFASEVSADVERVCLPLFAVMECGFDEVLFLEGAVPVREVGGFLDGAEFLESGAVFWAGNGSIAATDSIWETLEVEAIAGRFDVGQFAVRKSLVWEALAFARWVAEDALEGSVHPAVRQQLQKDALFLAWAKFGAAYMVPKSHPDLLKIPGKHSCSPPVVVQHDFAGRPLFQRRLSPARPLRGTDEDIPGLLLEATCRGFVGELREAGIGLACDAALALTATGASQLLRERLLREPWMMRGWSLYGDNRDGLSVSQGRKTEDPSFVVEESEGKGVRVFQRRSPEREVHFLADGTFGKWSTSELMAWDVEVSESASVLSLYGEDRCVARLELAADGVWNGRFVHEKAERQTLRLRTFDAATPKAEEEAKLDVSNLSKRMADHIVSLYACAGAAAAGSRVRFSTPFAKWFQRVSFPGLEVIEDFGLRMEGATSVNLNHFAGLESRMDVSQVRCYARLLGGHVVPVRPDVQLAPTARRFDAGNYVLLFPVDTAAALEWPELHWTRLAVLLREAGYEVIGVGTSANSEKLQRIFEAACAFWVMDEEPNWVIDAMLGAAAVISTANAAAHLAGLFSVPCVALHSQVSAEFLWECTEVASVVPETKCAPCRWDVEKGYTRACELGCSALATISPERVMERFLAVSKWEAGR